MGPYCNCSKERVSLERLTQKKFWSALRLCSRWLYILLAFRVLFLSVVVSAGIGFAQNAIGSRSSGDWALDQLLVQPKAGVPDFVLNRIFAQNGVSLEDTIPGIDALVPRVPEDRLETIKEALFHNPNFKFVEKNFLADGWSWARSKDQPTVS